MFAMLSFKGMRNEIHWVCTCRCLCTIQCVFRRLGFWGRRFSMYKLSKSDVSKWCVCILQRGFHRKRSRGAFFSFGWACVNFIRGLILFGSLYIVRFMGSRLAFLRSLVSRLESAEWSNAFYCAHASRFSSGAPPLAFIVFGFPFYFLLNSLGQFGFLFLSETLGYS